MENHRAESPDPALLELRMFHISMEPPGRRDLPVSISTPVGETSWSRCSRSAGALGCHTRIRAGFPRELHRQEWRFRAFSTYMSIAARVVPFARALKTLIKTRAELAKTIKDLKDLRALRSARAIDIKVLRT